MSAHREGDLIVLSVPERMSNRLVVEYAHELVLKLQANEPLVPTDAELLARALWLRMEFIPQAPEPLGVTWSDRQKQQWGSCTPIDRTIRISARLQRAPQYVQDYVIVHELAHLLEPNHGAAFAALEARYPERQRAEAFLAGADFASGTETVL